MNAKQKAIELRQAGYSYRYIHEKTGLAKSTLSYHLATVPFTPNAYTLKEKKQAQQKSAETKHRQKVSRINTAEQIAQKEIGKLSKRDIFMAGIALYVGEGSKTQNKSSPAPSKQPRKKPTATSTRHSTPKASTRPRPRHSAPACGCR